MKRILLLLIIPAFLVIIWFRNGLITGGGEEGILFYNPGKTLQLSTSVWLEYATGLSVTGWLSRSPIIYLAVIFEKIGIPAFIFQLALFYIVMIVGVISVYYLTINFLGEYKSKYKVALVSATFYLLNPFTMSQVWGRGLHPQYFSFALLPLSLLLFMLGIKRRKYFFAILIALVSAIFATAYGFITFIVVYWTVLIIYLLYAFFTARDKLKVFTFGLRFTILTFVLWFFINSWWLLPLFVFSSSVYTAGISSIDENLGTLMGVSRNFTPEILIRLLQRTYFFDPSAFSPVYKTFIFQLISFIPLIFVLIGLIKIMRSKDLAKFKFFVILLILGLIISLGANPPLGWLFVEIFKKFAILQAFRNPFEKFGLVYALGYSAVFAFGLVTFFSKFKYKWLGIVTILFLTCGIFAWPMWTGRVVAGPDKKIGLDVPTYYKDLKDWLKDQGGDFRLFMTPLWSGNGAFYQWGRGGRYQGGDPMTFILDQPSISNIVQAPFYYDFILSIRKYMERMNVSSALSLLRTKFLVDRKDAIFITEREKEHYKFLTSTIYSPKGVDTNLKIICQNTMAESKGSGIAWIVCQIPKEDGDLSHIRYLHVKVKTDVAANLDLALRDTRDVRIRWDGKADSDYRLNTSDWEYIIIPLNAPTEYNYQTDFSRIAILELQAHPLNKPQGSVNEIFLEGVYLDPGTETTINEFKKVQEFGNLTAYEPVNFNSPPEFGSLSEVKEVKNFIELFGLANQKRDLINVIGFLLPYQNQNKDLGKLARFASLQVLDKQKISDTRYWLKVDGDDGYGLILLSKTFNPEWKLVTGVSKEMLGGGLFNDLNFLKRTYLDEKDHYVVNGYANLWRVHIQSGEMGIIYMPQIIADISNKVTLFSSFTILGIGAFLIIKRKFLK